ncbi:unnamed protein product [Urochloa humidicola]
MTLVAQPVTTSLACYFARRHHSTKQFTPTWTSGPVELRESLQCHVKNKDIRMFLDGIYVRDKSAINEEQRA